MPLVATSHRWKARTSANHDAPAMSIDRDTPSSTTIAVRTMLGTMRTTTTATSEIAIYKTVGRIVWCTEASAPQHATFCWDHITTFFSFLHNGHDQHSITTRRMSGLLSGIQRGVGDCIVLNFTLRESR